MLLPGSDTNGYISSGLTLQGIDILIDADKTYIDSNPVGEILVKSPALMKGYYNNKEDRESFNKNG